MLPYLEKAHEVLLVINQSDKLGPYVIDPKTGMTVFDGKRPVRERVAKSNSDRKAQEKQVITALNDLGYKGNSSALSISMLLTKKGIEENNNEIFKAGNIETLFSKIEDLVKTDNDIRKLKFKDGRLSLINLITTIIKGDETNKNSMTNIIEEMSNFRDHAKNIFDKFNPEQLTRTLSIPIISELKHDITINVTNLMDSKTGTNDKAIQNELESEVKKIVNKAYLRTQNAVQKKASELLKELFVEQAKDLNLNMPEINIPHIKRITEEFEYEVSDVEYEDRDPEGLWENVCSLFGAKYESAVKVTRTEKKTVPLFHNSCDTENLKLFKIENKGSQLWKESNTQPILRRRSYLNFYC